MASIWAWAVVTRRPRIVLFVTSLFWLERYAREQRDRLIFAAREALKVLHGR